MTLPPPLVFLCLALGALLFPLSAAHAEDGCPDGYVPIGAPAGQQGPQGCSPIPGSEQAPKQQEPEQWEEHWISLAIDPARGVLGVDTDEVYSSAAELDAMIDCDERGGVKCRRWQTFKNTCAAVVAGRDYPLVIDTDLDLARDDPMRACGRQHDATCHVMYADCSRPIPVNTSH
ncbi:DUF4189 domain-containing protein [Frateuria terrea]|uniref:DUF4189 domain-containing protein n=1 Tax=Frateuria terrea TaxID=529704 RepID=A0A1H6U1K5_9GAMM|nr:DUF4189 domain-containing protein [Frateuria terrea]SEI83437.1 protein of unknown function [Frateuria terrea]SFP40309.1 protein of unknown function [Frateuria terrea]